jgi:hypothetical protein
VRIVHLTERVPTEEAERFRGQFLEESSYHTLLQEDADVYKPDGTPLLKFRKRVIPNNICAASFPILKTIKAAVTTRTVAAAGKAERGLRKDGTRSNTWSAAIPEDDAATRAASSASIGSMDRYQRFPYCRLTAFNLNQPGKFQQLEPFIRAVDSVFAQTMPDRYAAQQAAIANTHSDWIIPGTAFTTVTVNQNWRTAVHQDAGDLKAGFGVLTALQGGSYEGCYLCFPAFRVAVDMRTADVLCCDVHEWHGNTPLIGRRGSYLRISCVFYFRENMARCGTPAEELARIQRHTFGHKDASGRAVESFGKLWD